MVRKIVHHSAPRPDILSSWRQLSILPIPCHVHCPLSYCTMHMTRARLPYAVINTHTLFPGPAPYVRGEYVLGPCLRRAGCAHAAWAGGGSRSDTLSESVSGTAGRRRPLEACCLVQACPGGDPTPGRVVVRAALCLVEMESLQFVGCSWFIGLIGLVSDSPRINLPKLNMSAIPHLPCLF